MSLSLFKDGCGDIAVFVFLSGLREFGIYDASKPSPLENDIDGSNHKSYANCSLLMA